MQKVSTAEAAAALARPGFTMHQARGWIHRCAAAGIIPPLGKTGNSRLSPWEFDRETVQIAAVLRELFDGAHIQDAERLRTAYTVLASARREDGRSLIAHVMDDVERDGDPVMVVTIWRHISGAWMTSFVVRLTAEHDVPIIAPGELWEPAFDGVLKLAPVLHRFVGNEDNVVPLRKADS